MEYNLLTDNALYVRLYTWISPGDRVRTQIDHVLINKRPRILRKQDRKLTVLVIISTMKTTKKPFRLAVLDFT